MNDLTTFLVRYENAKQSWPITAETRRESEQRNLLAEAVMHIKWLQERAGAMTHGESFNDIAKRVGRQESNDDR